MGGNLDLLMYAGNSSRAMELLRQRKIERGETGSGFITYITHPEIRRTPEFQAILRKMGLPR